jgi:glucose/arabinose dehydrogenase
MPMRILGALLVVGGVLAIGLAVDPGAPAPAVRVVSASEPGPGPGSLQPPSELPVPELQAVLVAEGLDRPTSAVGDHLGRLFITEKSGVIRVVVDGVVLTQPLLDLDDLVPDQRTEQGLLSMALHPDFTDNALFYVNFTDRQGDTRVLEYRMIETDDGPVADRASARQIMWVDQPGQFHNGGMLQFGPEGHLFVSFGDGGFGEPQVNARDTRNVLGSIVRIDVDAAHPYAVPIDNPFVGTGSASEIWVYGMRNPWRFFIDPIDRVLVIGDVGQFTWEEITVLSLDQGGQDLGWPDVEGAYCYEDPECDPAGFTLPSFAYNHTVGCAVVGGPVYRGGAIPGLDGMVVYADFCAGFVRAFGLIDGHVVRSVDLLEQAAHGPILSLATDSDGEILILTQGGEVRRLQPAG